MALTHGHRDASGGVPELVRRLSDAREPALPILARPATLRVLRGRYARFDGLDLRPVEPGEPVEVGPWSLTCAPVPHARSDRFPTVAWRVTVGARSVVYASDVAEPAPALRDLARGVDVLVVDGATWRQRIFSHLRIDEDLPVLCGWAVGRILLTQIGRSAPPHEQLAEAVGRLCARAEPAYDGLVVDVA